MFALYFDRAVDGPPTAAAALLERPGEHVEVGRRERETGHDRHALATATLRLAPDPHRDRGGRGASGYLIRPAAALLDRMGAFGAYPAGARRVDEPATGSGTRGLHADILASRGRPLDGPLVCAENTAMESMQITPARRADAPRLAAMSRRLVEAGLEHCWTVERIERHLRNEDSVVLVTRIAGAVAGFAIMQYGDEAAHLNLLAVEPLHQRHGIGRRLVEWLEATARVAGTFTIRLEVRFSNRSGCAFYRTLGYRETGAVRGYYQSVEDAIRFERTLAVARPTGAGPP